jgi:hypothetical protein
MIEEFRGEFKTLREEVNHLKQCMRDKRIEHNIVQEDIKEIKTELKWLMPNTHSFPQLMNTTNNKETDTSITILSI